MDASGAIAVDVDTITCEDERGMVVLKSDGVGVVAPVIEVGGKLVAISTWTLSLYRKTVLLSISLASRS